jgi:acetylornithine deacetylase
MSLCNCPWETINEVREQITEAINRVSVSDDWLRVNPPEVTWSGPGNAPWLQETDHPFVSMFKSSADKVIGRPVPFAGMTASADARFVKYFGMPALMCGASGNAHAINEYVELDSVVMLTKVLASFLIDWCGIEE